MYKEDLAKYTKSNLTKK